MGRFPPNYRFAMRFINAPPLDTIEPWATLHSMLLHDPLAGGSIEAESVPSGQL